MKIDTEKLKRWREERFWSQEHLAELSGIALRAYNVDAAALTYAPEDKEAAEAQQKLNRGRSGLRLSFLISLASWAFIMLVFAGISLTDGPGGHNMMVPAIWVTVGIAGHGLAVAIVELVARFGEPKS